MEKVIVFGTNGMLGRYIYTFLKNTYLEIIPITRNEFCISLETLNKLEDFLVSKNINEYTCIINCIGLIPQKNLKNDYYVVNTLFPLLLSKYCTKYNSKLIHPTTDCVFDGKKGNYNEKDMHTESGEYGISKSLGEPNNHTIIRTSIIGEEKGFGSSLLEWVKRSKGEINGWNSHIWNGITCLQYAKIVFKIIDENLFWSGIRHIYSPFPKTKYELVTIIKETYSLDIIVKKIENEKIDKTLSSIYEPLFDIPNLEEQINDLKEFII